MLPMASMDHHTPRLGSTQPAVRTASMSSLTLISQKPHALLRCGPVLARGRQLHAPHPNCCQRLLRRCWTRQHQAARPLTHHGWQARHPRPRSLRQTYRAAESHCCYHLKACWAWRPRLTKAEAPHPLCCHPLVPGWPCALPDRPCCHRPCWWSLRARAGVQSHCQRCWLPAAWEPRLRTVLSVACRSSQAGCPLRPPLTALHPKRSTARPS